MFLDEIGELPLDLQAKLLRVIQEGEFERLGSSRTIKVDVRLIAATRQVMAPVLLRKQFRGDLYDRMSWIPLSVPPLPRQALRVLGQPRPLGSQSWLRGGRWSRIHWSDRYRGRDVTGISDSRSPAEGDNRSEANEVRQHGS